MGSISGAVNGPNQEPWDSIRVVAIGKDLRRSFDTWTDKDGYFEIALPPGTYDV